MADIDWERLRELFEAALELPAAARGDFVTSSCGEDEALASELRGMLEAHVDPEAEEFLVSPLGGTPSSPPRRIGTYELGRVIGSGGMGAVHEATQDSPRRTVALKLLSPRRWSERQVRRLELEADILGRLQHPGIAQVYAAGVAQEEGRDLPWFAMELVPGARTLTEYVTQASLDVPARLQLFGQVCAAVEHAHQRGVVHRDLKPSNILVDEHGAPRVIDFGVALLDADETDTTRMTLEGEVVGTLAYMSPEQCGGDRYAVDTRSDVYALGAILYELLAGQTPLKLEGLGLAAALDVVRSQAPRRVPELTGDLEAIAFKALEKDPARRYASVAALADDLLAWSEDRPIAARPPTLSYHLRLLARRHRPLVVAAAIVFVGLATAGVGIARYAFLAEERAEQAESARGVAAGERDAADAALRVLVDAIRAANPVLQKEDVGVVEIAEKTAERLAAAEDLPDRVQARVHWTLAATYLGVARREEAAHHARLALDALGRFDAPVQDRVDALTILGGALGLGGDPEGGVKAFRDALALLNASSAPEARAAVLSRLAHVQLRTGQFEEAEGHLSEAMELGFDEASGSLLAEVSSGLGNLSYQRGDHEAAGRYWERAIELFEAELWNDHPLLVQTRSNYTLVLQSQGRFDEARKMLEASLAAVVERAGVDSREAAQVWTKIGFLELELRDFEAAEVAFERPVQIWEKIGPEDPSGMGLALQSLGYMRLQQERFEDAREVLDRAVRVRLAGMPEDHPDVASARLVLGRALIGCGDAESARPLLESVVKVRETAYGKASPRTAMARSALGECELALGRLDVAGPLIEDAVPVIEGLLGKEHAESRVAQRRLELLRAARERR